jgi:two-component system cell cycle response regulator CpdR
MSRLVLVVDDEPLILELTASMLEDLGCEVVTADCGADALAKLKADKRIEILITDIQIPGLDGYELAEKAKPERPELQTLSALAAPIPSTDCPCSGSPSPKRALQV